MQYPKREKRKICIKNTPRTNKILKTPVKMSCPRTTLLLVQSSTVGSIAKEDDLHEIR